MQYQYGNTARYSKIARYLESPCDDKEECQHKKSIGNSDEPQRKQQKDRNIKKHSILMA